MTFACDRGTTLVPVTPPDKGTGTTALVALDEPGVLVTLHNAEIFRSRDAGCTWTRIDRNTPYGFQTWPRLVRGARGRVYGFQWANPSPFLIDENRFKYLRGPGAYVHGLGADRRELARLRVGDSSGQLHESVDAGERWREVGTPPPRAGGAYPAMSLGVEVHFDPSDLDHALFTSHEGAQLTRDGGKAWTSVDAAERLRHVDFSPLDGQVVWAWSVAGLVVSRDGGARFERVWASNEVPVFVGADTGKEHAAFVLTYASPRVFTLHHLDVARGTRDARVVGWTSMAQSPATSELWYVGLTGEPPDFW